MAAYGGMALREEWNFRRLPSTGRLKRVPPGSLWARLQPASGEERDSVEASDCAAI